MKNNTIQEIQILYPNKVTSSGYYIRSSKHANTAFLSIFNPNTISIQEEFKVLYLNRANKIIGSYDGFRGGITGVGVDPRIIFSIALKCLAVGLVVAHNHPSGNLNPSEEDKDLTKRSIKTGQLLDIHVLDHLILVPDGAYFSFSDEGLM